ncbi:hypothetical protein H6P81_011213 [Aristolochia fimbriata]|uniref:RINT1-like protein MAG2 n=1 Tax=Aristolochia fimbriata TaxID=158543 RepID=A0AAV7EVC4_ARIFI|nr:hypothetical protein H6P81_011213 [Aristolochia fimbriata]
MEGTLVLPPFSDFSPSLLSFLGQKFLERENLLSSSNVVSELQKQCEGLELGLADLNDRLASCIASYASRSERVAGVLDTIKGELSDLKSCIRASEVLIDGASEEQSGRTELVLAEELQALAKEVARVETVRAYAETALKLDTLIGDVEDAVSSSMTSLRKSSSSPGSEEMRLLAIKSLRDTEDILMSITKTRPQWTHLVSAVDHRVDRALAVLRPQAIADHRSLLGSLGWPPPLSNSAAEKSSQLPNPLFFMEGDLKNQYRENFLALCHLQELQRCRKSRQLVGHNLKVSLQQPLWAIEELVNPIAVASQQHFSKWIEKPEFIFALVYKITREFVDSMDEVLQPLVDKARLVGYSCREEWVSAMVISLSTYLAKEIFPTYLAQLAEESTGTVSSQAKTLWLHLVDLMISFDKRILSLVTSSGILLFVKEDEKLMRISVMSVFCDRPDWLEIWAQLELNDTLDKLKPVMENEISWTKKIDSSVLLSGLEDYKSPAVSAAILRNLSTLVDRCRPLPSIFLRARFIRLAVAPVMQNFMDCLLRRCQEAEGLTALADDDALVKVVSAINAARYCESVLNQWAEDIFFLEMGVDEAAEDTSVDPGTFILQEEIETLKKFQTEWVEKISTVILRGFDARCRDYLKNKKQWQDKREEGWTVSQTLVGALDYLQAKLLKLEGSLNEIDFLRLWRGLATGIDQLIFSGILMGNVKFHDGGVDRFKEDLEVLFGVFRAWCLRPEGFFPKLGQGLKLLQMKDKKIKEGFESGKERWLREHKMRPLSVSEAEKIIKNRVFMN